MKIRVTFKDPDVMPDSVDDAARRLACPLGVEAEEWEEIRARRAEKAKDAITKLWMDYGEYIVVDFDLDAGTATVVPRGA